MCLVTWQYESGHSKPLFIQELLKMTARLSIKSHRLYLRITASLTDDRAAQKFPESLSSVFLYSKGASLKLLGNRTYPASFPSFSDDPILTYSP